MQEICATHPRWGEVRVVRVLPQKLPVTIKERSVVGNYSSWPTESPETDELYYRKAIVIDSNGNEKVVPLRELLLDNKPLVQHVIEYEAIQKFKNEMTETCGERYLHRYYGVVEVLAKYSSDYWFCRVMSKIDVMSDAKFTVDFDQFKKRPPTSVLKEFACHPTELTPFKKFKPKDKHLYAAYADVGAVAETKALYKVKRKRKPEETDLELSAPDTQPSATRTQSSPIRRDDVTMKGIEEFLVVLADLPSVPKTKKLGGISGPLRTVKYREAPRVLARGETTGRLYITPAWWLWRVTGTFKQEPYKSDGQGESGKVAERYRWQDPRCKESPPPPTWYSYDPECEEPHYDGFLMDLPEIIPSTAAPAPPPLLQLQEKKAWYWQLPTTTAREFSISRISIRWAKAFKVGSPLALLGLSYKGKEYRLPVYLTHNYELTVRVKTKALAAFLCRYTIAKLMTR